MGLRDKIKNRLRDVVNRVSGEYSAVAPDPETVQPYERPGVPQEDAKVLRARLKRPLDE